MTSAAIYARVSSARQAKDETIGSQLAALREHAAQSRLDVPEEWVFADEGHSGATLVRPGPGGAAGPGRPGLPGRGAGLLPGPAGPQVRLPGAADRGTRPLRDPGRVREGAARRQPRGPAAGPVPGHVRRVREGPADGAVPARQGLAGEDRQRQRAVRRPVRLPLRPQDPRVRRPLRGRPARGRPGHRDVPPLRRRRRGHRGPAPLADGPGGAHPHRQGTLGPVGDLGHAPQPRLRRDRGLRQDPGRPRAGRAEPHRPAGRAHRPPAGPGRGPAAGGMDRDPGPGPRGRGHLQPGAAAAGGQQAVRLAEHQGPVAAAGPGRLRVLRLRLLPHLHHDQPREEDLLLPVPRLRRLPLPGRPRLRQQARPRRLRRQGRLGPRHRPARRPRPHPRRDRQKARAGPDIGPGDPQARPARAGPREDHRVDQPR